VNTQPEVVLVHLGVAKAKHLWANINYLKQNWPKIHITLIGDQGYMKDKCQKMDIGFMHFDPTDKEKEVVFSTTHNSNFRQGFWNYSLLRLFAVLKYVEENSNKVVIHIESDVILMRNFPFEVLADLIRPAWLRFNESHDVASIFLVPNQKSAKWLREEFYDLLLNDKNLTDMTMLSFLSHKYPGEIEMLPIAQKKSDHILRDHDIATEELEAVTQHAAKYGGVFDSAPIGMWLLGQDPRNHKGRLKRYIKLDNSFVQPNQIHIETANEKSLLFYDDGVPIFDLHIHSKELKYFDNWNSLNRAVKSSQGMKNSESFLFIVFIKILIDYFTRHGFRKALITGARSLINRS
jgi:hypothetical protein